MNVIISFNLPPKLPRNTAPKTPWKSPPRNVCYKQMKPIPDNCKSYAITMRICAGAGAIGAVPARPEFVHKSAKLCVWNVYLRMCTKVFWSRHSFLCCFIFACHCALISVRCWWRAGASARLLMYTLGTCGFSHSAVLYVVHLLWVLAAAAAAL